MKALKSLIAAVLLTAMVWKGNAQPTSTSSYAASSPNATSVKAQLLVGLRNVPAGTKGTIDLLPEGLAFRNTEQTVRLNSDRISAVSVGDERAETGGFGGKLARVAIPYGGGAALGTMTQKQVGLLTVSYLDEEEGLRSAIFVLPKTDAQQIADTLQRSIAVHPQTLATQTCDAVQASTSIRVLPVESVPGLTVPPEYRALLYERLLELSPAKLRVDKLASDGGRSAACSGYALALTVEDFSKGNAALRASTGPIGLFVGATKLKVRVQLRDAKGRVLLDKIVKASRRGDKESLNAASSEVADIAKQVKKINLRVQHAR